MGGDVSMWLVYIDLKSTQIAKLQVVAEFIGNKFRK